jgi:hypothetical protein
MTPVPFILGGLVLVTIAALSALRNWRLRRDEPFDAIEWLDQTAVEVQLASPDAATERVRQFQRNERDFNRSQFRRRMQISGMLGLTGLLLPFGALFDDGVWNLAYAAVLLALVGWMLMLALADLIATRHHFSRVREHLLSEALAGVSTTNNSK